MSSPLALILLYIKIFFLFWSSWTFFPISLSIFFSIYRSYYWNLLNEVFLFHWVMVISSTFFSSWMISSIFIFFFFFLFVLFPPHSILPLGYNVSSASSFSLPSTSLVHFFCPSVTLFNFFHTFFCCHIFLYFSFQSLILCCLFLIFNFFLIIFQIIL